MKIESSAFSEGEAIPREYTCEGENISPPLVWSDVPEGTQSLVLIVDDPDAPDPDAPKMTWVHWVVINISPTLTNLSEGMSSSHIPAGVVEGINDWKRTGYGGACPPIGRHRYFHKLYALDTVLEGVDRPTKTMVEKAMAGHVLAEATLIGTYEKSG